MARGIVCDTLGPARYFGPGFSAPEKFRTPVLRSEKAAEDASVKNTALLRHVTCMARLAFAITAALVAAFFAFPASAQTQVRNIAFPVEGPVTYKDDFSSARYKHLHEGNDLMGTKMQR